MSFLLLHSRCMRFTSSSCRRAFSTTQTGTVVFYMRNKAYGFIRPDDSLENEDVFVHRSGLKCPITASQNPSNPFLKKGERVRYELSQQENNRAMNVTYEDGLMIPLFRNEALEKQKWFAYWELGQNVFTNMSSQNKQQDEEFQQIQKALEVTKTKLSEIRKRSEMMQPAQQQEEEEGELEMVQPAQLPREEEEAETAQGEDVTELEMVQPAPLPQEQDAADLELAQPQEEEEPDIMAQSAQPQEQEEHTASAEAPEQSTKEEEEKDKP